MGKKIYVQVDTGTYLFFGIGGVSDLLDKAQLGGRVTIL